MKKQNNDIYLIFLLKILFVSFSNGDYRNNPYIQLDGLKTLHTHPGFIFIKTFGVKNVRGWEYV